MHFHCHPKMALLRGPCMENPFVMRGSNNNSNESRRYIGIIYADQCCTHAISAREPVLFPLPFLWQCFRYIFSILQHAISWVRKANTGDTALLPPPRTDKPEFPLRTCWSSWLFWAHRWGRAYSILNLFQPILTAGSSRTESAYCIRSTANLQ